MSKRWILLLTVIAAGMIAMACGSDDDELGPARVGGDGTASPAPTAAAASSAIDEHDPDAPCPVASTNRPAIVATPGIGIDQSKSYEAVIKTNKGEIRLELFDDEAPVTVNNFVHLARCGYYDNITFHRVIADFMVQSGDPTGSGGGGPGYTIPGEFSPNLKHDGPGVLSMANTGGPDTGAAQFFITHGPTPHLDGYDENGNAKICEAQNVSCHAVFGQVIDGQDVVDSIVVTGPGVAPDPVESIEIIER